MLSLKSIVLVSVAITVYFAAALNYLASVVIA